MFAWLWGKLTEWAGLIMPAFAGPRDYRRFGPILLWTVHILGLTLILVGLWAINWVLRLDQLLEAPSPLLRKLWLPLLFLLLYLLFWLGWWLWKLLGPESHAAEFPDIDRAWEEAVKALNKNGIELSEVPLFLILGMPEATLEGIFEGSGLSFKVVEQPRRHDAPLHVWANKEGIFLACPGASLLARFATLLVEAEQTLAQASAPEPEGEAEEPHPLAAAEKELGLASKEEEEAAEAPEEPGTQAAAEVNLLKDGEEVERLSARLEYLCRLVARDRHPFCPANGILVMVPWLATTKDDRTLQAGQVIQRELGAAQEGLQTHCPRLALVCDLETLPGCRDLLARIPKAQRAKPLGQPFPLVPDVEAGGAAKMVEGGVQWVCCSQVPGQGYRLFKVESAPGKAAAAAAVRGNVGLYRFLSLVNERQRRLVRILQRGFVLEREGPLLLGGVYLAATGQDENRDQAFIAPAFRRMIDNQDFVSWTDEAVARNRDFLRWVWITRGLLVAFSVILVALVIFFWKR